jgi:schlafen family protein
MTPDELKRLLQSDETDQLERKSSLSDTDGIRDTLIQFANDLAGRGGGHLILGQAPDKSITGLAPGDDEVQRKIADIVRDRCRPAIPVMIECHDVGGLRIAIVEVRASAARPHFTGNCYVRVGSTKRAATDAEIMALRYAGSNPKIAQLQGWLADARTMITAVQMPKDSTRTSPYISAMKLLAVNATYVVLQTMDTQPPVTLPIGELEVGWDYKNNRPQIFYSMRHLV